MTPKFKYAAKVNQSRYGICSHAAIGSTLRNVRIIHKTSAQSNSIHINAKPYAPALKKINDQKKLIISWTIKRLRLRLRSSEGSLSLILAALIPINAYRIPQTIGKTIAGGESGGCATASLNILVASRVSHPPSAPTPSAIPIQIAYVFQCFRNIS